MGKCTALSLHGKNPCNENATTENGLFCGHHGRTAQGLYLGYKRRNTELEQLDKKSPKQLPKNWTDHNWDHVLSPETLLVIHSYLHKKHQLLHRVITAREIHHEHFYKDTSDYGHQAYLDKLRAQRTIVQKALGKIERRMMHLKYAKEQWMEWAGKLQAEEEARREDVKKKVKAEAALYRENMKEIERVREQEEKKRREQMEQEDVWDPIEYIIESKRIGYISLLRMMLQKDLDEKEKEIAERRAEELSSALPVAKKSTGKVDVKSARIGFTLNDLRDKDLAVDMGVEYKHPYEGHNMLYCYKPDPLLNEIIARINKFVEADRGHLEYTKEASNAAEAGRKFTGVVQEIREYAACRIIASKSTMLAVGLESSSLDDFLRNPRLRNGDLRDLCLGLNSLTAKDWQDACAAYWGAVDRMMFPRQEMSEEEMKALPLQTQKLLREVFEEERKSRVKICGKWVYHSNVKRNIHMTRRAWYQFSILTGVNLETAIEFCDNFEDYHELNVLALQGYFIGTPLSFFGHDENLFIQHARRLGFIPYKQREANLKRLSPMYQERSYICARVARDTDEGRRFISMARTWCSELCIYARDAKLDAIICEPPEAEKWLSRKKAPSKNIHKAKWVPCETVGSKFFRELYTGKSRVKPGFNDYIDMVIWDRYPDRQYEMFSSIIIKLLYKANYIKDHLSLVEKTFDMLEMQLDDEERLKGPRTEELNDLRKKMKEYRLTKTQSEMKCEPYLKDVFYTDYDAEIDWAYGIYDNDEYWDAVEGKQFPPTNMFDLNLSVKNATDHEQAQQLEDAMHEHMMEGMFRQKEYADDMPDDDKNLMQKRKKLLPGSNGANEEEETFSPPSEDVAKKTDVSKIKMPLDDALDIEDPKERKKAVKKEMRKIQKESEKKSSGDKLVAELIVKDLMNKWKHSDNPDERKAYESVQRGEERERKEKEKRREKRRQKALAQKAADETGPRKTLTDAEMVAKLEAMGDLSDEMKSALETWKKELAEEEFHKNELKSSDLIRIRERMRELALGNEVMDLNNPNAVTECDLEWSTDESDSELESDSDDDDDYDPAAVWQKARDEGEEFTDWANDFAAEMFESQKEMFPDAERNYERTKKFMMNLQKKRLDNLNKRRREKLAQKEQSLTGKMSAFFPENSMYTRFCIQYFWDGIVPDEHIQMGMDEEFKVLLNRKLRAKYPPPRRSSFAPQCIWDEWDRFIADEGLSAQDVRNGNIHYPKEWEEELRISIAALYKEGVIRPSYSLEPHPILAGREKPDALLKLYCDYRSLSSQIIPHSGPAPDKYYLRNEIREHEAKHPGSRYTFFKMRSAEYYWNSETFPEDMRNTTIQDTEGRVWEWLKTPKDLPFSELDMHCKLLEMQAGPHKPVNPRQPSETRDETDVKKHTRVRVDTVIVMYANEEEARELTWLAAGYFRKRPIGLDIDWARSFVNVDADFLLNLREEWWE